MVNPAFPGGIRAKLAPGGGASMPPSGASRHTFVLVHGAWHGGWCWRRVSDLLLARGHRVFAPTLTGLGERSHLLKAGINLSTHIEDVTRLIEAEDLSGITLVGHSYGGMVVSGVAERAEKAIASIVLLDAFVPENAEALLDFMPADRRKANEELAAKSGGLTLPPLSAEFFNVNERDRAWVDAKCTPQPFATFAEKARLTGARERIAKKTYVRAGGYPAVYFSAFHTKLKADPSWRCLELPCGHDIMIDMPERLADVLEEAA
jgi:pimeloyl-ACP methyl ester carboxylesterase